jgi:ubiquinone/menaquinone biosynthesis C-methylase UbiE
VKRRDHDTSSASRRYHDRVARQYDAIYDDAYWEFHDRLTWESIRPHLPTDPASPCLDIGCGTGKWGLKTLKSGYPTTFVDHAANMIEKVRDKLTTMGPREKKATLLVADIVDLSPLPDNHFALLLAMGDPLSICSDPAKATREMFRISRPGAVVIATADNKLAALEHYMTHGAIDHLEDFIHTGKTKWLTQDDREKFLLTTFTPATLRKLFTQAGFEVTDLSGKTILPLRRHRRWLENPDLLDRLLKLERRLSEDPSSAAVAGHLQITATKL